MDRGRIKGHLVSHWHGMRQRTSAHKTGQAEKWTATYRIVNGVRGQIFEFELVMESRFTTTIPKHLTPKQGMGRENLRKVVCLSSFLSFRTKTPLFT